MPANRRVFNWPRGIVEDLIILYESQSILYTTKSKEYKNRLKRIDAVDFIRMQLREKYPRECEELTNDDITRKIHTLRTQYGKEVVLLKKCLASGASSDAYTPKLWCFDSLQFLHESEPVVNSESNYELPEGVNDSDNADEIVFEGSLNDLQGHGIDDIEENYTPSRQSSTPSSRPSTSKRQYNNTTAVTALLNSAVQSLEEYRQKKQRINEEDEFEIFGRTVAVELRNIKNGETVRNLKKSIFMQIMDAQHT